MPPTLNVRLLVERVDGGVRVSVTGSPATVLSRLSAVGVSRLQSHAPTLEQIFLTYYEHDAVPATRAGHEAGEQP